MVAPPSELLVPPTFVGDDVDDGEMIVTDVDPRANVVVDVVVDDSAIDAVVGVDDLLVVVRVVVVTRGGTGRTRAVAVGGEVDTVPY